MKIIDVLRLEIGDLFSRRAIKRLRPEVIDPAVAEGINNAFTVMRETDRTSSRTFELQGLQSLVGIYGGEHEHLHVLAEMPKSCHRNCLRIGRDVEGGRKLV